MDSGKASGKAIVKINEMLKTLKQIQLPHPQRIRRRVLSHHPFWWDTKRLYMCTLYNYY